MNGFMGSLKSYTCAAAVTRALSPKTEAQSDLGAPGFVTNEEIAPVDRCAFYSLH